MKKPQSSRGTSGDWAITEGNLILVVADFKEDFLERIGMMKLNTFGIPVEPLGYTPKEFENMKRRKNPFILEVLEKGKSFTRHKRQQYQT